MPTENWYTISDATHDLPASSDQFTSGTAANKNAAVQIGGGRSGAVTHDDDTSYIYRVSSTANLRQAGNISWPGPVENFLTITAGHRTRSANATVTTRQSRFSDASGTLGNNFATTTDGTQLYSTVTPIDVSAAIYRPGGGSWTKADFVDDKTIFSLAYSTSADGGTGRWTSIFGELGYNPPSGGFAFLLGLAGLVASPISRVMDFGQFMQFLSWREKHHPRHTKMFDDEIMTAWSEIKSYRHPVFFGGMNGKLAVG